jgi:hypothetical protein
MPLVRHRAEIDAPVEAIWDHLLRKVERPQDYVPAAVRSEILARPAPHTVERLMILRDETGEERPTREVISSDRETLTIVFKLTDSPVFTGLVTNSILDENGTPVLDITMNWVERPGAPGMDHIDWQAMVTDAVEQTKRQVEAETRQHRA